MPRLSRFLLAVMMVGGSFYLLAACEHAPPEQISETPSFSTIQNQIFSTSCAISNCHIGGEDAPHGLDLSAGQAYDNLVNVPSGGVPRLMRVDPNNPDSSYLVLKLEGDPVIEGSRMPRGAERLDDSQISTIRRWIAAGAPRN